MADYALPGIANDALAGIWPASSASSSTGVLAFGLLQAVRQRGARER